MSEASIVIAIFATIKNQYDTCKSNYRQNQLILNRLKVLEDRFLTLEGSNGAGIPGESIEPLKKAVAYVEKFLKKYNDRSLWRRLMKALCSGEEPLQGQMCGSTFKYLHTHLKNTHFTSYSV